MSRKRLSTPPSREVRLEDQLLHGEAEQIAFDIYTGDAGTLANSMVRLELVMERDRSRSIEAFAFLLKKKLAADGYIVIADIENAAAQWHEEEVLGIPHDLPPKE